MKFSNQLPKLPPSEMKKVDNNNHGKKINEIENKTKTIKKN